MDYLLHRMGYTDADLGNKTLDEIYLLVNLDIELRRKEYGG
jgi:hypothetical protein